MPSAKPSKTSTSSARGRSSSGAAGRRVPALGLLAQAHADALDREPAAQLGRQRRGHGAAVVQRGELARDAADDGVEPAGRGGARARRDAGEGAAADGREAVQQLARVLVGDLGADRRERRAGVALERHDDGRDALGAVLGERRLDAGAIAALDREHAARRAPRAARAPRRRSASSTSSRLAAVAPAAATRLARSSERPGARLRGAGRSSAPAAGTANAAAIPADDGADQHDGHEHGRVQQRARRRSRPRRRRSSPRAPAARRPQPCGAPA